MLVLSENEVFSFLFIPVLQQQDKIRETLFPQFADNPCAAVNTAMSSALTQTVNPLSEIQLLFADTYYTDGNAFSLTNLATPTGGTFYINDAEAKLFNPKNNPVGIYSVRYVVTNSNGCTAEAETTFELKVRTNVTITVLSSDETMGSVSGGGICLEGTTVTLTAIANTGYHFVKWQDGVTTATREISVKSDATYTATFAVNVYVVSFLDWDETVLKVDNVEYGNAADAPSDPTREGYTFIGWNKDFSNVTADMIVTAQYEINRYEVQFLNWDDSELQNTQVIEGDMPVYTGETPTRDATPEYTYTFAGWTPAVVAVTGNATYTASYDSILNTYNVTFVRKDDQAISYSIENVPYGTALNELVEQVIAEFGGTTFEDDMYIYTYIGLENVSLEDVVIDNSIYYVLYSKEEKISTNIYNTGASTNVIKVIRDNHVYILRGGKTYTIQGQELK